MKYTYLLYPLLSLGVLTNVSYANTFCQTAEHEINTSYKKFRDFDDVNLLDNFDKNAENLSALILKTLNDKQSLACDWSNLTELDVNKSPDGRLLSISWQTDGGGTMKTFDTALQYHDGKHLHATTIDNGFVMKGTASVTEPSTILLTLAAFCSPQAITAILSACIMS